MKTLQSKKGSERKPTALRRLSLLLLMAALCLFVTSCGLSLSDNKGGTSAVTTLPDRVFLSDPTVSGIGSITIPQYPQLDSTAEVGTYMYVAEVASPSVVSITTETVSYNGSYVTGGAGSGVIIYEQGDYTYIVTNKHVIDGSSVITVHTNDADPKSYEAGLMGSDWLSDIAVIRIAATGLTKASIGTSATLSLGQEVAAIGNPLGVLGGTITDGIIGCLARTISVEGVSMTLIQHSAGVNPGNSGGGLFNLSGQLIGIVNAKSSGEGVEALGYAIPIDLALERATEIIEKGYVSQTPYLGLGFTSTTYSSGFSVVERITVTSYAYNSELSAAGETTLQSGDILQSLNGVQITETADIRRVLSKVKVGDRIEAVLLRSSGRYYDQEITVHLTVHETPAPTGQSAGSN